MSIVEREKALVSAPAEREQTERERRASTLEAAALEIEVLGWTQGVYENCDGAVCLRGAVGVAQGLGAEHEDTESVWGVDPSWHSGYFPFGFFNDRPERTAGEVTFLLRWRAEEVRDGR